MVLGDIVQKGAEPSEEGGEELAAFEVLEGAQLLQGGVDDPLELVGFFGASAPVEHVDLLARGGLDPGSGVLPALGGEDQLAGGPEPQLGQRFLGALGARVEEADGVDLVAEEFEAGGAVALGREDVEDAAAAGEFALVGDGGTGPVAELDELLGEFGRGERVSDLQGDRGVLPGLGRGEAHGDRLGGGDDPLRLAGGHGRERALAGVEQLLLGGDALVGRDLDGEEGDGVDAEGGEVGLPAAGGLGGGSHQQPAVSRKASGDEEGGHRGEAADREGLAGGEAVGEAGRVGVGEEVTEEVRKHAQRRESIPSEKGGQNPSLPQGKAGRDGRSGGRLGGRGQSWGGWAPRAERALAMRSRRSGSRSAWRKATSNSRMAGVESPRRW
ncbi:hypothetical protein D3C87_989100 [compost metagenome]